MTNRYRPPRCSEVISRKAAIARGCSQYYTGKPCKHGHLTARSVANWKCMTCGNLAALKWHAANPEKAAENKRQWSSNGARLQDFRRRFKAVLAIENMITATKSQDDVAEAEAA